MFQIVNWEDGQDSFIDGIVVEQVESDSGASDISSDFHYWHPAPNNAIGQTFLENFASSAAVGSGLNKMSRGYSLFDQPLSQYANTSTATLDGTPLVNADDVVPYPLSQFGFQGNVPVEIVSDTNPPEGGKALKLTKVGDSSYGFLGNGVTHTAATTGRISLSPGKRWILSWWAKVDQLFDTTLDSGVWVYVGNTQHGLNTSEFPAYIAGHNNSDTHPPFTTTDWERHHIVFDLSSGTLEERGFHPSAAISSNNANTMDSLLIRIDPAGWGDTTYGGTHAGNSAYYSAFQLEEVQPGVILPSPFQAPSDDASIVFGRQITDGKIVTHYSEQFAGGYGPRPHITPSGMPNPEPHGDFWINTSNAHMIFRYHQNGSNHTAQTANYSYYTTLGENDLSGWYTGQDEQVIWNLANTNQQWLDIANTLAQTAFAQSRIDNDISAYFYPNTATATIGGVDVTFTSEREAVVPPFEFGDIWIDTGPTNMFANGTLSSNAIHRAQNVAGDNILYWNVVPNDAIGRVYLETWATKNSSDRKTVTYLSNSFGAGGTHGPNTWTTFDGIYNANPEGDFWLNTALDGPDGTPNNQLFIYKTNSSFSSNQTYYQTEPKAAWAQTIHSGVFTYDQSPMGWWDATDTRVNAAFIIANTAYGKIFDPGGLGNEIEWAFGNIAFQQTTIDNDRVILYYPYGYSYPQDEYIFETSVALSDGLGSENYIAPGNAAFGDIWINTSGVNQQADGSLHANAIHRGQNSSGGSSGSIGWYRANTNQLGLVYLDSYLTRNIADRKTAVFFSNGYGDATFDGPGDIATGTHYGPNVSYTDPDTKNIFNPNPEGDLWYDMTLLDNGTPRNVLYVYKTNSSFTIGTYNGDYDNAGVWAQTTHSGVFDSTSPTGWWDVQDSRLSAATIAADREIIAFFVNTSSATVSGPPASGNGDIWIQIDYARGPDGLANTAAIYRYDTRVGASYNPAGRWHSSLWIPAPDNALGKMYLETVQRGSFSGTNIMPRGYSLWDAPLSDYSIGTSQSDDTSPYHVTHDSQYSEIAIDRNTGNSWYGSSSLRAVLPAHDDTTLDYFWFGDVIGDNQASNAPYRINIPKAKRWIFSFYVKANTAEQTAVDIRFLLSNTTHDNAGKRHFDLAKESIVATDTWQRFEQYFDFSTRDTEEHYNSGTAPRSEVTALTPIIYANAHATQGVAYHFDAFQLEEVADPEGITSFTEPSEASSIVFGRRISDGKVIAHFEDGRAVDTGSGPFASDRLGPTPNTTPKGLANPDPNGDMWIDTANNNVIYQYYANSAYGTGGDGDIADTTESQKAYYVKVPQAGDYVNNYVGWISTENQNIAAANLAAYNANLAATWAIENRNKIYAQDNAPTEGLNEGDVWFDTDDRNRQYTWDGSEWVVRRDEAVLFALAGSDPYELNPFFSNWSNPDGHPEGWLPSEHLAADDGSSGTGECIGEALQPNRVMGTIALVFILQQPTIEIIICLDILNSHLLSLQIVLSPAPMLLM